MVMPTDPDGKIVMRPSLAKLSIRDDEDIRALSNRIVNDIVRGMERRRPDVRAALDSLQPATDPDERGGRSGG